MSGGYDDNQEWRRIHLLQAALQVKGATQVEIQEFLQKVEKMGGEKFAAWNQLLDPKGMQFLVSILDKNGKQYADIVLQGFLEQTKAHFQITSDEIYWAVKARLEGLN